MVYFALATLAWFLNWTLIDWMIMCQNSSIAISCSPKEFLKSLEVVYSLRCDFWRYSKLIIICSQSYHWLTYEYTVHDIHIGYCVDIGYLLGKYRYSVFSGAKSWLKLYFLSPIVCLFCPKWLLVLSCEHDKLISNGKLLNVDQCCQIALKHLVFVLGASDKIKQLWSKKYGF